MRPTNTEEQDVMLCLEEKVGKRTRDKAEAGHVSSKWMID